MVATFQSNRIDVNPTTTDGEEEDEDEDGEDDEECEKVLRVGDSIR